MNWKRIEIADHAYLCELDEDDGEGDVRWERFYIPKGKRLWPLLAVGVLPRFMPRDLRGKRHKISVYGSIKKGRDSWWDEEHGIPTELLGDVEEMFAEVIKAARGEKLE